jgi:pilus assembly protein CpaC
MSVTNSIREKLGAAERLYLSVLAGLLMALGVAKPVGAADAPIWIPVSINAGETYTIGGIKPGTSPSFDVEQNPNAFVTYNSPPDKLTILGAAQGHWTITVINAAGHQVTYDVHGFAVATPGAPLKPGNAPPAISDESLGPRLGAGAPASTASAVPELATISGYRPSSAPTPSDTSYSVTIPDKAPPSSAVSWDKPLTPVAAAGPYQSSQTVVPRPAAPAQYRSDPSVLESGSSYLSDSVSGGRHYLPPETISLMAGTSQVIDFQRRVTRISVADSKIADVQVIDPFELNLIAHQPGFTTLAVWDNNGQYEERTVRIDASGRQQVLLNTIVAELDRTALENQGINLSAGITTWGLSLVGMPGQVATPYTANTSLLASSSVGSLSGTSNPAGVLPPGGQIIPLLLSSNITYGLSAQNNQMSWQGFFQFLEQHNLGKVLAQPQLLANSGEEAKFLSGGEIPIVIAQALNSSIVFKTFGTSVQFVPTVVGRDDLELLVKPEVSEPDYAHGVELFGFNVPAFVTRRAETMVRLRDHQTLIIAGLVLHEKTAEVQKVPYLGDIPYVAGLFRNTYWSDQETDLVMSVTPEIVQPLPSNGQVYLPTHRAEMTAEEIKTKRIEPPDPARPRF